MIIIFFPTDLRATTCDDDDDDDERETDDVSPMTYLQRTQQARKPLVGYEAPEFEAAAVFDQEFVDIKLSDYRGKYVVLFFYPLDFTFVCPTEIVAFNNALDEFEDRETAVLTASTDSVYSHKGWCDSHEDLAGLKYLMLADTNHSLSEDYGVLDADKGIAYRGVFLIDPQGVTRWLAIHDLGVGRNVDEVLRVLDALQTDKLCPCNWKKGDETLN